MSHHLEYLWVRSVRKWNSRLLPSLRRNPPSLTSTWTSIQQHYSPWPVLSLFKLAWTSPLWMELCSLAEFGIYPSRRLHLHQNAKATFFRLHLSTFIFPFVITESDTIIQWLWFTVFCRGRFQATQVWRTVIRWYHHRYGALHYPSILLISRLCVPAKVNITQHCNILRLRFL